MGLFKNFFNGSWNNITSFNWWSLRFEEIYLFLFFFKKKINQATTMNHKTHKNTIILEGYLLKVIHTYNFLWMPVCIYFLEDINFTKNLKNYLQLVYTKKFKCWVGNLAIHDFNPGTLMFYENFWKLRAFICFIILKTPF